MSDQTCPTLDAHGDPFKYCPNCDWIEPAESAVIGGTMPSGKMFNVDVSDGVAVVRVDGRTSLMHPRVMSDAQCRQVAAALLRAVGATGD